MTGVILAGTLLIAVAALRKLTSSSRNSTSPAQATAPRAENESAFMAASFQAVIQKLREDQKESEREHQQERERAEGTKRLLEEITRNMPAGMLVVTVNGLIAAANPAAESSLGFHSLTYRRYSEALGSETPFSLLIQQCLSEAATFRNESVAHITNDGVPHEFDVTVLPIRYGEQGALAALCLWSVVPARDTAAPSQTVN